MGLVGPSLEDIRKKDLVRNFSKSTAMQCCIQTMTAVRDLHGIGYLHRDIKPQNYAIGLGPKETTIYMLDFGIARKYTEGETKVVKVPRIKVHFLGTLRFASRACHKQIEQGRKDDLECWLYMCFDLFDDDAGLPWKRCEREEILSMKQKFFKLDISSCYRIVPEDFKRLVQYIDGLKYADEPDYVYLRNSLAAISRESKVDFSKPLDWAGITTKKREKPKAAGGSDETSTDNKQEETGSGEKEEDSKARSRFGVDNDPDVIQKLCPAATQLNYHAISRGGTKVDKRSNSGSEDQLLTAGSSEEERREGEEIDDARHDKELDIGWDGELTDESNDEDDYD
ncbi:hypothetical protein Q1695_006536 [Nippostrongylus brasiliensis]|nr:hypothetical protein Q1695_006536 [Nippostrongylus brasiliensis]